MCGHFPVALRRYAMHKIVGFCSWLVAPTVTVSSWPGKLDANPPEPTNSQPQRTGPEGVHMDAGPLDLEATLEVAVPPAYHGYPGVYCVAQTLQLAAW